MNVEKPNIFAIPRQCDIRGCAGVAQFKLLVEDGVPGEYVEFCQHHAKLYGEDPNGDNFDE